MLLIFNLTNGEFIAICLSIIFGLIAIYQTSKANRLQNQQFVYDREKNAMEEKKVSFQQGLKALRIEVEVDIYFDFIKRKFQYLDFTGLNAILQRSIKLENIYIKLKTVNTHIVKQFSVISDFEVFDKPSEQSGVSFMDSLKAFFENRLKIRDPVRILILGHPGSGKTTLLKWIVLQCFDLQNDLLYGYIPIYISLKTFGKDPDNTFRKYNILDISKVNLTSQNIVADFLHKAFSESRVLFLLDGLDEVANESVRREIIDWIQNQSVLKSLMIITSRFSGIQPAKGIEFKVEVPIYEIQNFSKKDVFEFLDNWHKNVERAVSEEDDDEVMRVAKGKFNDLLEVLNNPQHKNLMSLAVNPLLLTIIAIVHRTRAVLPKERHKLYEEAIKVMIELWNIANRKIDLTFSVDNSISNLSAIAVYLMKNNARELNEVEVISVLPKNIEGKPIESFINEITLKSGLVYLSEGKYGFLHLTFQEYLTARYFARSSDQNLILEYIDKDFWTETIRLFINIGNVHIFFKDILQKVKIKNYRNVNFVLDLANEIVVEEERFYYAEEALNFVLLELLEFKNKKSDSKRIYDEFFPALDIYRNYKDKLKNIFLELISKAENPFAKNIGVLVLGEGNINQEDFSQLLKSGINKNVSTLKDYSNQLDFFKGSNDSFNQGKRIFEFKDENEKAINDLEFFCICECYLVFNLFAMFNKNIEDLRFVFEALKSNHQLLQYLAIVVLRDYKEVKIIAKKIQIEQLVIIKPLKESETLSEASELEIKAIKNLATPKDYLQAINSSYNYWKELRPLWQFENLQAGYISNKIILKQDNEEIKKTADLLLSKLK